MDSSFKFPLVPEALGCVVSLNAKGEPATLGDWMDQEAPLNIKQAFSRAAAPAPAVPVLHIDDLDFPQQKQLAMAVYANTQGRGHRVTDLGMFTREQQLEEIRRETSVGKRIITEVVTAGRAKQDAIKSGRVQCIGMQAALNPPPFKDPF